MSSDLRIAFVHYRAAQYACAHWHYSGCMPSGKLVKCGVWEGERFVGVVLFGRGANNNIGRKYAMQQVEVCELVRIALRDHATPVTRIMAVAIRKLLAFCPGVEMIVSYADPKQGHHGGVYQAANWVYAGPSYAQPELLFNGEFMHKRTAFARFGTAAPKAIAERTGARVEYGPREWKHTYLLPLSQRARREAEKHRQPYPKRVK